MRAVMVQGTSSGAGKTTLVAALCRILADRGHDVAPFKSQNMSCLTYRGRGFEISRAQALQAMAARCEVSADLNPVLLKPLAGGRSAVYVGGRRLRSMGAREYYAFARSALGAVSGAMSRLAARHDVLVIEGAGSPAEINLRRYDIANMRVARMARAKVILVSDIDRGGSFASLAGTMSLLGRDRALVRGFVLNKFRGDPGILEPGLRRLRRMTGVPVLGVVPVVDAGLPEEDSLGSRRAAAWDGRHTRRIEAGIRELASAVGGALDVGRIEAML